MIYRGYQITAHANGGLYWTDERGFHHFAGMQDATPLDQRTDGYPTEEAAMDSIDQYRRNLRKSCA